PAGVPAGAAAAEIRALSLHAGPSGYVEVLFMTCPVLQPGSNGMVGSYGVLTSLGDSGGTLSTDANGQIAFLRVQLEAARKGAVVLVPTTPVRYDLVLHYQGLFHRAQVKYVDCRSPNSQGAVRLDLRRRKRCYTLEEIDVVLAYVPQIDKVCWLPAELFHQKVGLQL